MFDSPLVNLNGFVDTVTSSFMSLFFVSKIVIMKPFVVCWCGNFTPAVAFLRAAAPRRETGTPAVISAMCF